jgi:hypothetical protein
MTINQKIYKKRKQEISITAIDRCGVGAKLYTKDFQLDCIATQTITSIQLTSVFSGLRNLFNRRCSMLVNIPSFELLIN